MTRFSKVFQMITVVLVIAVVNVYVMGAPKASTDPKKGETASTEIKTDTTGAEIAANTTTAPAAAAEKLPLAPGSKVDFNRLFSRTEIKSQAAASHNFLNAKTAGRDVFKAPPRTGTVPQNDTGASGGGGSRGTWIAVGIIAAVLTIAVIGLRKDRRDQTGSSAP